MTATFQRTAAVKLLGSMLLAAVLLGSNALAADCGNPGSPVPKLWLPTNDSTGGTGTAINDLCGDNNFARNSTTELVTGIWDGAQDFELGDKDQFYNYSTAAMGLSNASTANRTMRLIWKPESSTALQIIAAFGSDMAGTDSGRLIRIDERVDDYLRCLCGFNSGTPAEISSTGKAIDGSAYDIVCRYNGTYLSLFINGTLNGRVATPSGCRGENSSAWLGTWDGNKAYPADGTIEAAAYWQTDLTDAQILSLYTNNYINAPAAGGGAVGCTVTSTAPADASTTNDSTPTMQGTLTCYGSMATSCTLYANGTALGSNSTLSNGTAFDITSTVMDIAAYQWNLSCTNTTYTNSSANRTLNVRGCGNLTTANTLTTLVGDVSSTGNCFNVTAFNNTIDCNGYTITYASSAQGHGVNTSSAASNLTVKNCVINEGAATASSTAIYAITSNLTLYNNTINTTGAASHGIYINNGDDAAGNSSNITANKINVTSATSMGLYLNNSGLNNVTSNRFTNPAYYGLYTQGYNSTFNNNTFTGCTYKCAYMGGWNEMFVNNTVTSTAGYGLWLVNGTFIVNSTFNNSGYNDVYSTAGEHYVINTTLYHPTNVHAAFTSMIFVQWYVWANFTNCSNASQGANATNISFFNTTAGAPYMYSNTTDASGIMERLNLTQYRETSSGPIYYTNYTAYAALGAYNAKGESFNLTESRRLDICLLTDWAPNVTLTSPANNYNFTCLAAPCTLNFTYVPRDEHGLTKAELWANFTSAWALNQTNNTDLVNGTNNTFAPVTLPLGFYIWNVNVTDDGAFNASFAAANYSFRIANLTISVCSGAAGEFPVLNFTFEDEENFTNLAANFYGTFWFTATIGNASVNMSSNITANDTYNVTICVSSSDTYIVNSWQFYEYNGTSYDPRSYFLDNATLAAGTFTNITLYLLNSTFSMLVQLEADDSAGQPVQDALVYFARYYPGENLYRTVAMVLTDDFGLGNTYLRPNDVFYRITLSQDHQVIGVFGPQTIGCNPTASQCALYLSLVPTDWLEYVRYIEDIAYYCSFNSTGTNATVCSMTDTSGLMQYARLVVWKNNIFSPSLECDVSMVTSSGTLTCPIVNFTGTYTYVFSAHFGDEITLETGTLEFGARSAMFGAEGLLLAFFIVISCAAVGIYSPGVSVIMGSLGVLFALALGVFNIEFGAVVAIVVVGLALFLKMRS